MSLDVLVPQDLQRDVLALQLAVHRRPVGLGETAVTLLLADSGKELCFQRRVDQFDRQWPAKPGGGKPLQRQSDGRWRHADPAGDLVAGYPGGLQPKHIAHLAHRDPLCWHRSLPWQAKGGTLCGQQRRRSTGAYPGDIIPEWRAKSSRNAERDQIGTVSDMISDSRATSPGIRMLEEERRRNDELQHTLADAVAAERIVAGEAAALRVEVDHWRRMGWLRRMFGRAWRGRG